MFHKDSSIDIDPMRQDGVGDAEQILQRKGSFPENIFQGIVNRGDHILAEEGSSSVDKR